MDELPLISLQINVLKHKLTWVEMLLKNTQNVNPELYERLGLRFSQLIESQRGEIEKLEQASNGHRARNDQWKDLEKVQGACEDLFGEALAFLGGIFLRYVELDQGIYHIADGLCSDLSKYSQVYEGLLTIPALRDSFTGLTNIIRMRFPDFSIWGLPIVAHEFGHYLESERSGTTFPYLFGKILTADGVAIQRSDPNWCILQEQFADLFAVFALGPAYACSCILLEFDPRQSHISQEDHPSYAERAYFIHKGLQKLQENEQTKPFNWIISQLNNAWEQALQGLNLNPITQDSVLDRHLEAMYTVINNPQNQLSGVRYKMQDWIRARNLSTQIINLVRQERSSSKENILRQIKAMCDDANLLRLPDIFNAAWLCRLREGEKHTASINWIALAFCHQIISNQAESEK